MVNHNGQLIAADKGIFKADNRALAYGDALMERVRVVNGQVFFLEEHYLKLMASMRILRMEIPMNMTMEFFESELLSTAAAQKAGSAFLMRFLVYRDLGGPLVPAQQDTSYVIGVERLDSPFYTIDDADYEVDLFKDFYKGKDLLAQLETTNSLLKVTAGIFARENGFHDGLLLNDAKEVVESIQGNLFVLKGTNIRTTPVSHGATDGVVRKKVVEIIEQTKELAIAELPISPFELQKADSLFITNTRNGIIPITKYRKKRYTSTIPQSLLGKLNAQIRISTTAAN